MSTAFLRRTALFLQQFLHTPAEVPKLCVQDLQGRQERTEKLLHETEQPFGSLRRSPAFRAWAFLPSASTTALLRQMTSELRTSTRVYNWGSLPSMARPKAPKERGTVSTLVPKGREHPKSRRRKARATIYLDSITSTAKISGGAFTPPPLPRVYGLQYPPTGRPWLCYPRSLASSVVITPFSVVVSSNWLRYPLISPSPPPPPASSQPVHISPSFDHNPLRFHDGEQRTGEAGGRLDGEEERPSMMWSMDVKKHSSALSSRALNWISLLPLRHHARRPNPELEVPLILLVALQHPTSASVNDAKFKVPAQATTCSPHMCLLWTPDSERFRYQQPGNVLHGAMRP